MSSRRFDFDWDTAYQLAALPFGIVPRSAYAEVSPTELRVRFGPWTLRTARSNVLSAATTGGYVFVKTAGPPHLSFSDRGVSFGTNGRRGVCVTFDSPVAVLDPTRRLRHPGATLTLADPEGFADALGVGLQAG